MLELGAGAHEGAFKAYSERVADWGYGQVPQMETAASLSLPIVEAIQSVGKINAAVEIRHLAAEVGTRHSIGDVGESGGAGITKEVAVHAAQGCDVVLQKRMSHRRQVMVTYLLPPSGGTICRGGAVRVLNGRLVGGADSMQ